MFFGLFHLALLAVVAFWYTPNATFKTLDREPRGQLGTVYVKNKE